jgi:hypothetical protein
MRNQLQPVKRTGIARHSVGHLWKNSSTPDEHFYGFSWLNATSVFWGQLYLTAAEQPWHIEGSLGSYLILISYYGTSL